MYSHLGSEKIREVFKEESERVNWNGGLSYVKDTAYLEWMDWEKSRKTFNSKVEYKRWVKNNYENTYKDWNYQDNLK